MTDSDLIFSPQKAVRTFADVVLPLALPKPFTYVVPESLVGHLKFGMRVEVQFGRNRLYSGLVVALHQRSPQVKKPKPILALIDEAPILLPIQYKFWSWMAGYYGCTLGEVMHAALPAHLRLASETTITLSPLFEDDFSGLDDQEYLIAEALKIQKELSLQDVRGILQRKTVFPVIRRLMDKKIIYLKEDLKDRFRPKKAACVRLQEPYASDRRRLEDAFALCGRSNRQLEALMAYVQLARQQEYVRKADIYKLAKADASVVNALVKKGIVEVYEREVSRLGAYEEETQALPPLSEQQQRALSEVKAQFETRQVVLLHGVTGSGKTRLYMELIQAAMRRNEQVLYLLPEIALTAQVIERLQRIFGDDVKVYHSRLNNNERVELWQAVLKGQPLVLGPRSALFLPYSRLKLVIVDEEHDMSYKQQDPNPRYQGRDAAIMLAAQHGAKVLLGTATPSLESYQHARTQKYGLVEMPERFGGIELPEVRVVDARKEMKARKLQSHFTSVLLDEIRLALEAGDQVILFQNRRGFAPLYRCDLCDWHAECIHCDVSLTYHRPQGKLKCHYCGYQTALPTACPACGNPKLSLRGFGTQKIEDELQIYLPDAKIGRMDLDTVRSKHAHARIINAFEEGRLDVLVGTQMVTKGLDFEHVGLVGVLSADQLLHFPDFRSAERAFQLMTQVAGRAGRKKRQGKVVIQAMNPNHPVLQDVLRGDYQAMFRREVQERHEFKYPPFYRLIRITLKHRKPEVLDRGTVYFSGLLKEKLGSWVIGPAVPYVSRVRAYYLMDMLVKLERHAGKIAFAKQVIREVTDQLHGVDGFSGVRVQVDVDPF